MNIIAWLTDIMLQLLNYINGFTGNYGLSIIILTVVINTLLFPLTSISIKQMGAMQKIQPKMKEIQTKYKDDPKQMQKEIMDLYKKEKVNPFGGCLPMLLKIPFFLALFFALKDSNISQGFLWLSSLSLPDKTMIMPIAIGITTYLSQKSMPNVASGDAYNATKTMNTMMPFLIAAISVGFPSGVQLYWVVANLVAYLQQAYIQSRMPA